VTVPNNPPDQLTVPWSTVSAGDAPPTTYPIVAALPTTVPAAMATAVVPEKAAEAAGTYPSGGPNAAAASSPGKASPPRSWAPASPPVITAQATNVQTCAAIVSSLLPPLSFGLLTSKSAKSGSVCSGSCETLI